MNRLVIGCGYIGHPVARAWVDEADTVVDEADTVVDEADTVVDEADTVVDEADTAYTMTRKPERAKSWALEGLTPVCGDITKPRTLPELPLVDTVLFSVGMDSTQYENIRDVYVGGLSNVLQQLPDKTAQLIYISSTGVYGNFEDGFVDEQSSMVPERDGGRACLEAETLIANSRFASRSTILRLAGIYGPNRIPALQAIRDRDWTKLNPDGYINLIHRDDAVQAILATARQRITGETILISDGIPLPRREFYPMVAEAAGAEPIPASVFENSKPTNRNRSSKRVCNEKMKKLLDFKLKWSDLRSGIKNSIRG